MREIREARSSRRLSLPAISNALFLVVLAASSASCGGTDSSAPNSSQTLTRVTVSLSQSSVNVGEIVSASAIA